MVSFSRSCWLFQLPLALVFAAKALAGTRLAANFDRQFQPPSLPQHRVHTSKLFMPMTAQYSQVACTSSAGASGAVVAVPTLGLEILTIGKGCQGHGRKPASDQNGAPPASGRRAVRARTSPRRAIRRGPKAKGGSSPCFLFLVRFGRRCEHLLLQPSPFLRFALLPPAPLNGSPDIGGTGEPGPAFEAAALATHQRRPGRGGPPLLAPPRPARGFPPAASP